MPRIKAFCGIRPAKEWADRVITVPPDFPLDEAVVTHLKKNPCSFLHLVAPVPDNEFMQGSRDALVYRQAGENLQTFLENGYLLCDQDPCLYLYSVETPVSRQTGVWAVTLFDDYLNNTIRKHEYTRVERENGIADYLRQTGIDANPVLIAYRSHPEIEEVIARSLEHPPLLSFEKGGKIHTLHAVREAGDIRLLIRYFGDLPASYLADGHHRAAALSSYGVERRKFDFKHSGNEEYNYFSSIYFSAGSLEIKPFQRLVNDLNGLTPGDFMDAISKDFIIEPVSAAPETGFPVTTAGWRPGANFPVLKAGHFGMYLAGHWYLLSPVESAGNSGYKASSDAGNGLLTGTGSDPVEQLDVTRLQERILGPVLGIDDPRTDERLRFSGGTASSVTLAGEVDAGKASVLFTLFPTSIDQLMEVADAGMVMPPKSTWFEPKLDLGILTHFID